MYLRMINGLLAVQLVVNYSAIFCRFSNAELHHNALGNHMHVTNQLHIRHVTETREQTSETEPTVHMLEKDKTARQQPKSSSV